MKIISKEIDIVTVFEKSGNIKPIRFKFEQNDGEVVVRIDKVLDMSESNFAGENSLIYKCQSTINNICKLYEIKYIKRTCKWYLYKM